MNPISLSGCMFGLDCLWLAAFAISLVHGVEGKDAFRFWGKIPSLIGGHNLVAFSILS